MCIRDRTYSVAGTETLTEIKVSLTRNTNVGASTIAVDAKFNDPALSGPAEVTFADGSNTAIYTIAAVSYTHLKGICENLLFLYLKVKVLIILFAFHEFAALR